MLHLLRRFRDKQWGVVMLSDARIHWVAFLVIGALPRLLTGRGIEVSVPGELPDFFSYLTSEVERGKGLSEADKDRFWKIPCCFKDKL